MNYIKTLAFFAFSCSLPLQAMAETVVTDGAQSGHSASAKVMSFNVRFNNPKDTLDTSWAERRLPCARTLRMHAPDIAGLQEPRVVQKEDLYALLPEYGHFCVPVNDTIPEKHSGNAVLLYRRDKYEPLDSGYFWLSATPWQQSTPWNSTDQHYRVAVWLHLLDRTTGKDCWAVTTHFPYKKADIDTEVRARCATLITSRLKDMAGDDAVIFVTGDLNASPVPANPEAPGSRSLQPFFDWMQSARHQALLTDDLSSFNGFGRVAPGTKGKILDHIFYRNARALTFETATAADYGVRWNSDHYPIIATFTY